MPFVVGENVGPYRIMEQLGQGGMATVYKAYHAALDRYVALKVLHPAFHEDKTFTARFQREARVVAKLEHPNIVPVYDYAEHEGRPYLVMKYIEGETLKSRLARGPLTTGEINRVVDAVGSALAYAHKQGILHRDIKPSNVLIATDGQMYLADFGLARIAQAGESTLSSDSIMGTPQYISPEQARGDRDLDAGTDIYSFGVMLYEMVVGQVPFSADTPFSIIHDHIYTPLPLPRAFNPSVPESVERVLLKALAKDRHDRYPDVASMVQAFESAWTEAGVPMQGTSLKLPHPAIEQEQGPTPPPPPPSPSPSPSPSPEATVLADQEKKKKKRSPWLYASVGVLLVFCCLFVFLATRGNPNRNLPQRSTRTAQEGPSQKPATGTHRPSPDLPTMPPEVLDAKRRAEENPDDPFAKLDLAVAYWKADMPRQAYETLNEAANQVDPLDVDFFIDAGNRFKEHEAWLAAAGMYTRAIKAMNAQGAKIPDSLFSDFHESIYKAAIKSEMNAYLPFDEIARIDQPMALVAQGRNAYFNGSLEDGRIFLSQAQRLKPGLHEEALLEGEFAIVEKRYDEARLILNPLASNLGAPEWIRMMAEEFLQKIP